VLEPVAYGLKFAGSFSGGIMFETGLATKLQVASLATGVEVNRTAHAAKLAGGETSVIMLNKQAASGP